MKPNQLLAALRDGAAVNQTGLREVGFTFPTFFKCVCRTQLKMLESTLNLNS